MNDDIVYGFMIGMVFTLVMFYIIISGTENIITIKNELIAECEKELPRNEKCVYKMYAIRENVRNEINE